VRSVTWFVRWRQKKCLSSLQPVAKNTTKVIIKKTEMYTVQEHKLNKTKHV